tara:strand:- start:532 stop:999 length:468 start_codon:yes stop_codon:yes gene_type:complete
MYNQQYLNSIKMNKDKIFDLFDNSSDSKSKTKEKKKALAVFNNSPYHKLGMFTKLIVNHFVFHSKLEKFLKKEEPTYNVQSTKEASEFVVFNRAFNYLSQINPLDKEVTFAILDFDYKMLNKTLESALQYFQELEEYEKCAHIFKFQKILKERKK